MENDGIHHVEMLLDHLFYLCDEEEPLQSSGEILALFLCLKYNQIMVSTPIYRY
jgi:hypothetical protein